jgi:hypothetical protein
MSRLIYSRHRAAQSTLIDANEAHLDILGGGVTLT